MYDTIDITTIAADAVSDEIDVTNLVDKWVAISGLSGGTANIQVDDLDGNLVTIGSLTASPCITKRRFANLLIR